MKKVFLSVTLLSIFFLMWCTSKEEIAQLKQQNDLLQQQINQQIEQKRIDKEEADLALQQKQNFENNLKCQERWDSLKLQYNNFMSAYYNEYANTCYVKYYDKKSDSVMEAPMENMVKVILETPLMNWSYEIKYGVNLRTSPWINWNIIQKIDPTNTVDIFDYQYVDDELWYNIDMYWTRGWISSKAF